MLLLLHHKRTFSSRLVLAQRCIVVHCSVYMLYDKMISCHAFHQVTSNLSPSSEVGWVMDVLPFLTSLIQPAALTSFSSVDSAPIATLSRSCHLYRTMALRWRGTALPVSQELGRASCLWMLRSRWGARTVLGILDDTPVSAITRRYGCKLLEQDHTRE